MPTVLELNQTEDVRDAVLRAVETLAAGNLIAVPTETVYGIAACALNETAVQRLYDLKGRDQEKPFTFAVKSMDDALDYVPNITPIQRRLARRCWPGPVTFVFDLHPDSVVHRLPELIKRPIIERGTIGLRVPAHDVTLEVLRLTAGPLVLTSANISGEPDITDGGKISGPIAEDVELVLNDGPTSLGQPSSVVRLKDGQFEFLREGVVDGKTLESMSKLMVMIVCTGNTCRSPMGEALFRHRLAEKLELTPAQLDEKGIKVVSAGVAAMSGALASPQSVEVMEEMGLDIEAHASQPVTPHLVQFADLILTMTERHRQALITHWPGAASRTFSICRDQGDVSDPIGMPVAHYKQCSEQIDENVKLWVDHIIENGMVS